MQNSRFVVLMGHLDDYPLSDLVGILRHQRKTGRLLIEYPNTPASFYFEEGELVDVQIDELTGLQAICMAIAQPASPFNFNPLIRSAQRSLDHSLQRVVSELFGCWDESPLQINTVSTPAALSTMDLPVTPEIPADPPVLKGPEVLALPAFVPPATQNRTIRATAAAGLMLLGISSVIAVTGGFQRKGVSDALATSSTENQTAAVRQSAAESITPREPGRAVSSHSEWQKSTAQTNARRDSRLASTSENSTSVKESTTVADPAKELAPDAKTASKENVLNAQWVDVVMHVENGRVLQAAIANHKSGVDSYEALALRIARQRRYPTNATGPQTVRIRVAKPE